MLSFHTDKHDGTCSASSHPLLTSLPSGPPADHHHPHNIPLGSTAWQSSVVAFGFKQYQLILNYILYNLGNSSLWWWWSRQIKAGNRWLKEHGERERWMNQNACTLQLSALHRAAVFWLGTSEDYTRRVYYIFFFIAVHGIPVSLTNTGFLSLSWTGTRKIRRKIFCFFV